MNDQTIIQAAQLFALPLAFGLAGYGFSASQNNVLHLSNQPARISTPIFSQVYHAGATVILPGAAISAVASAYLAYALPSQRLLWAAASTAILSPLPFTAVVMLPGINRLLAISESTVEQEKVDQSGEHVKLLQRWVAQNYVRASMYLAGGMCGLVAVAGLQ